MHRASTRQAELDARVLRERRIGRRLLDEPETYTAMAERPARALLGGTVASLVVVLVVAVVAAAGSARTARRGEERARGSSAATAPSRANPGAAPSTPAPSTTAATTVAGGTADPDAGLPAGVLPTVVSVDPAAAACQAREAEIEVIPLFTQAGALRRVELDGLDPGCVGREMRVSVRAPDGAELGSQAFVLTRAGWLGVGNWQRDPPLRRAQIGEVVVEIL
jgi:hypothetical protein